MLYILRKFSFFWLALNKLKKELLKHCSLAHHLILLCDWTEETAQRPKVHSHA